MDFLSLDDSIMPTAAISLIKAFNRKYGTSPRVNSAPGTEREEVAFSDEELLVHREGVWWNHDSWEIHLPFI